MSGDNVNIIYKDEKIIDINNIRKLFSCVDWFTPSDENLTQKALANSSDVFTAWDNEKLVGLVQVIADGGISVHVHYLLVLTEYRNKGIGTHLMNMVIEKYKDYVRLYIESRPEKVEYYNREFGFESVTSLKLMKKDLKGKHYLLNRKK